MASETQTSWGKRVLVGVGVLAILLVEVGVAYVLNKQVVVPKYFNSSGTQTASVLPTKKESADNSSAEAEESDPSPEEIPVNADGTTPSPAELNSNIYMVNDLIINPAGSQGGRYVAMSIGLGVDKQAALDELKNRDIQIRDAIIALLSQKTLGKFIAIEERVKLKQQILDLVNDKLNADDVESIYFTEFVIQ